MSVVLGDAGARSARGLRLARMTNRVWRGEVAALLAIAGLLAILVLPPLVRVLQFSALNGVADYLEILTRSELRATLLLTLLVSLTTTTGSVLLGGLLAFLIVRTDLPFRGAIRAVATTAYFIPTFLFGIAWIALASPGAGLLNVVSEAIIGVRPFDVYTVPFLIVLMIVSFSPLALLTLDAAFQAMDARLEEVAAVQGASSRRILLDITLPLALPAVASSFLLVFVLASEIYGLPYLLGVQGRFRTLAVEIYLSATQTGDTAAAARMSIVLLVIAAAGLWLYGVVTSRGRRFVTVSGQTRSGPRIPLGPWKYALLGVTIIYLIGLVALPIGALIYASLQPYWGSWGLSNMTLNTYARVFGLGVFARALVNTITVAILSATVITVLSLIASLYLQRSRNPLRRSVEYLATLPVAMPGVLVGLGMLITWVGTPIYGGWILLLMVYVVRFIPNGFRTLSPSLFALDPTLEESAKTSGAGPLRILIEITVPLIARSLAYTWTLVLSHGFREVSAVVFIYSYGQEVLSVLLLSLYQTGNYSAIASLATIYLVLVLAATLPLRRLGAVSDSSRMTA